MSHPAETDKGFNISRFFVQARSVAWLLLLCTAVWGYFSYQAMPKRKDPVFRVRTAAVVAVWPGAPAARVEELLTKPIEAKLAQNAEVETIEAYSRTGISFAYVHLRETMNPDAIPAAMDDLELKLAKVELPPGARPIHFEKDFGDTAAVMLTVGGSKPSETELALRADALKRAHGPWLDGAKDRAALVWGHPLGTSPANLRTRVTTVGDELVARKIASSCEPHAGEGALVLRCQGVSATTALLAAVEPIEKERFRGLDRHLDVWTPFAVARSAEIERKLTDHAGDAFSYDQLDRITTELSRKLKSRATVAKVTRTGVVGSAVYLEYSQTRLAALGLTPARLSQLLTARNLGVPGGFAESGGRVLALVPNAELSSVDELGAIIVGATAEGAPIPLRDVVDITRDYDSPPALLNRYSQVDAHGKLETTRAITLSVQLREGRQIHDLAEEVEQTLAEERKRLPEGLVLARTADQPKQVEDKVNTFLRSLYEAVLIIIVIGFIGFREWRSSLLLALSIPVTLAMTFGFMYLMGLDIQQMSLAALIIALGLLVDDPVVAGDSIRAELDAGKPRGVAAWLGPTKLANAILFATITNIAAYLPFLLIPGDVGRFIYALPMVLAASLVASRIVSMTFIPLLGYALLRRQSQPISNGQEPKPHWYRAILAHAIRYRYAVLAFSSLLLVAGALAATQLRESFFPRDLTTQAYVDVYLPEDAALSETSATADRALAIVEEVSRKQGAHHGGKSSVLKSVTTFVGGPAPRFWYSLSPKEQQFSYAQLVLEVSEPHELDTLLPELQRELSAKLVGARADVQELLNGPPVAYPIELRFVGDDAATLRALGEQAKEALRATKSASGVRDDWGVDALELDVRVDEARAKAVGVTHADVVSSTIGGFLGTPIGTLRDGDRQLPVITRLTASERGNAQQVDALYVLTASGKPVPLAQVADVTLTAGPAKLARRDQLRTLTVAAMPIPGALPSDAMKELEPALTKLRERLPPTVHLELGGAQEKSQKSGADTAIVGVLSTVFIFLALVIQFRSVLKPVIVFFTIPYGAAGAVIAIVLTGQPFGFTAILGITSLIGVIVSHVLVLFDYLQELEEHGLPLREALVEAGTKRFRPVVVTVAATVLGLVPLALHGGPLWEPLCYSQIGGLTIATFATLLFVPLIYVVFVEDLRIVRWGVRTDDTAPQSPEQSDPNPTGASFDADTVPAE